MATTLRARLELALLLVLFLFSGAAGLIYESIWARYLGLLVGHTAYAQVIVLATFLGGMSLGAFLAGERAPRLREPLLAYAVVEVMIGLFGVAFHTFFLAVEGLAESVIFPWVGAGGSSLFARIALATLLILPPSVLLGTTFPLMTCGVLRRIGGGESGRVLSLLYFANTIGAAVAVLAAGFLLIEIAGLPGTVTFAGILNLAVALGAWLIARSPGSAPVPERAVPESGTTDAARVPGPAVRTLLFAVAFGTAVGSFAYEIAWIRMLSLVIGSASHSFELMLSAFILGLALGSFWIRRRADLLESPLRTLGRAQWIMGMAAIATLFLYQWSFDWMVWLLQALSHSPAGYTAFNVSRYGIAVLFMLPATFCAGVVLPLLTKVLLASAHGEKAIGRVYALNTLGSIVGVVLAALVLLPTVGFGRLLVLGAAVDITLGVLLLCAASRSARSEAVVVSCAAIALAVAAASFSVGHERAALASGVYRGGATRDPLSTEVLFYRDGRTATVTVTRAQKTDVLVISTNGKADASLKRDWAKPAKDAPRPVNGDEAAQLLLAMITLAHRPLAEQAAVVGQGSGMSSHLLLSSERMKRLVTIEIEPEMVAGSREFLPANRRVFEDPRSAIVIDDAKSYFAASGERFDLVLSEPSNPWVSGVSSLFTTEFYRRIRKSLAPGGVFGQWLQVYDLHDGLVLSVLAAIHQVFPDYRLYLLNSGDLLIVASAETVKAPDWSVMRRLAGLGDIAHLHPFEPPTLDALRIADRSSLAPFLDGWTEANSDFFPILDLGAERSRFLHERAHGLLGLAGDRFTPIAQNGGPMALGASFELPIRDQPRLQRLWLASQLHAKAERDEPVVADAAYRTWRWRTASSFDLSPSDWRRWTVETHEIEALLHGGPADAVDEEFYASLRDTIRLGKAPEPAHAAIAFLESMARGNLRAAVTHVPILVERATKEEFWTPLDSLFTGGILASLEVGDVEQARRIYALLSTRLGRSVNDLRNRLLDAKIGRASSTRAEQPAD